MKNYSTVKNLSKLTLYNRYLKILTDGDITRSSVRLFQASTSLLLKKKYFLTFYIVVSELNWTGHVRDRVQFSPNGLKERSHVISSDLISSAPSALWLVAATRQTGTSTVKLPSSPWLRPLQLTRFSLIDSIFCTRCRTVSNSTKHSLSDV